MYFKLLFTLTITALLHLSPSTLYGKNTNKHEVLLGGDLGIFPTKEQNIVFDTITIGYFHEIGQKVKIRAGGRYFGMFGRKIPFVDVKEDFASRFSMHNAVLEAGIITSIFGFGAGYSYFRIYNVMHDAIIKSTDFRENPKISNGDFSFTNLDMWITFGNEKGQHIKLKLMLTTGVTIKIQTKFRDHFPFFEFGIQGPSVVNAVSSPGFVHTKLGILLTSRELSMGGLLQITPYIVYRYGDNFDYRLAPYDYASLNIGIELRYLF
jgi:hypothetical protein